MKVGYTEEINVTKEVPDYFDYDDSKRGRVVDVLVGDRCRNDLFSEEKYVVEWAISELTSAYEKADLIVALFDGAAS